MFFLVFIFCSHQRQIRLLSIKYKRFVNFLLMWIPVLTPYGFKESLVGSRFTIQKLTV